MIFITGVGRCATRAIARSLDVIDGIDSRHEYYDEMRFISNEKWNLGQPPADVEVQSVLYGKQGVDIDSNCLVWNCIGEIYDALDGEVFFINITRNKADTVRSMNRTRIYGPNDPLARNRATRNIGGTADLYDVRSRTIRESLADLPTDRYMTVRFEDITDKGDPLYWDNFVATVCGELFIPGARVPLIFDKHRGPGRGRRK